MSFPKTRPDAVLARLRHKDSEHPLKAGSYVLGRHKSCDIVLDSKHVSRQHARIDVSSSGVLLYDLGSANGVWVNGQRLGEEPVWLRRGDRVLVGQEELELLTDSYRPLSQKLERLPVSQPSFSVKEEDEPVGDGERSSPGTRRSDFFDLVGKIVERAIEEGRTDDAATMLQSQLTKILGDARAGRSTLPGAREGALRFSLLLAAATKAPRWLEYALELCTALRWAPDPPLSKQIENLVDAVEGLDPARVGAYVAALESLDDPLERLRATHWARGLLRASSRRPK